MPIKWKTTEVETPKGKVKVTHWEKHDPIELIETIKRKPIMQVGEHPKVKVHQFGPHQFAVRNFFWLKEVSGARSPKNLFRTLKAMAESKSAVVETPVAFVDHPLDGPAIVTLWKKKSINMQEFLEDKKVAFREKRKACLSAARKMAVLHALGISHGHPRPDNFVVDDKTKTAQIVDYTLLNTTELPTSYDRSIIFENFAHRIYQFRGKNLRRLLNARYELARQMEHAYQEQLRKLQQK